MAGTSLALTSRARAQFGPPTGQSSYPTNAIQIVLTTASTSPLSVPSNWNSSNNTIEVIGAGGGGGTGDLFAPAAGGGGGGYSKGTNVSLTPGGSANFSVGAAGSGSPAGQGSQPNIAPVQSVYASGTTSATTSISAVTSGNALLISVLGTGASAISITDNTGTNTYSEAESVSALSAIAANFYCLNITNGPISVTATATGASETELVVTEVANLGAYDSTSSISNSGTSTTPTSGAVTIANNSEYSLRTLFAASGTVTITGFSGGNPITPTGSPPTSLALKWNQPAAGSNTGTGTNTVSANYWYLISTFAIIPTHPATAGGNTWFGGTSFSSALINASGGGQGLSGWQMAGPSTGGGVGGTGGGSSSGLAYTGATGGLNSSGSDGGAGGGGAAGPNGNGGAAGQGTGPSGAGGGGNGGGSSGANSDTPTEYDGGSGGNGYGGSGGGSTVVCTPGSNDSFAGNNGTTGTGGGGSGSALDGESTSIVGLAAGNGASGSEWGAYGSGGGGGGSAGLGNATATGQGGDAGNYGAGGGGSGTSNPASNAGRGGNGAPGIIVITYVPT